MSSQIKKIGKNILITLSIPVVTYVVIKLLCVLFGDPSFAMGTDLETICYTAIYTSMISLAMSYHIFSGRFDFAIGATISLSAILAGNIAKDFGMGPWGLLAVIILTGMVLGLIAGLTYVTLGLPPMVTSLGVAMIYESIGLMYNSSKGVRLIGKTKLLIFSQQKYLWILLFAVAAVSIFLFEYTRFGYNQKALATGQKIAVDIGIREKRNAVGCYVAAGALLGIAGVIYLSKYGTVSPEAGLSSSSYFMGAFLPLFIGGAIGKFSNSTIGVIVGAFTSAMISSGFVKLGFGSSMQTVMNGLCVMVFLIYTSNSYKFVIKRMHKAKLERALADAK
ncbi:ABC transporter permease [Konateibacter massiliensis]|uniref:ABC transporter permease n=1 Tax=Konateibacter massiliensis TaxID=2002841 RepID=UPI000C147A5D|nr:hypothetical protein [Konateibacter massiliensis]